MDVPHHFVPFRQEKKPIHFFLLVSFGSVRIVIYSCANVRTASWSHQVIQLYDGTLLWLH